MTATAAQSLKSHYWWELSTRDFAALDMSAMVAILPVGAVEQHGPHLPVQVDACLNAGIVARCVALMDPQTPALVLPAMPVGKSNEHISYPGTLTFSWDTLARMWIEIGESVLRAGCRRLIIFNSHGGQPQVMDIVCRELRVRHGMLAIGTSWFGVTRMDDLFSAHELKHGIHGGEVETSMMLALRPDLVDMRQAGDFTSLSVALEAEGAMLTPEGAVGFGWQTQDLAPAGACGDAAKADAQRGQELIERAAHALLRLCHEASSFPLSRFENAVAFKA
ncbi:MAG: Creatininase [Hyphomicrobiales bacterium]|nr:Creatininase [Hyphomicrobiales bacterium]